MSSHGVGILFTYEVSNVIFSQKHFAVKITLKPCSSNVHKICYTSGNPG